MAVRTNSSGRGLMAAVKQQWTQPTQPRCQQSGAVGQMKRQTDKQSGEMKRQKVKKSGKKGNRQTFWSLDEQQKQHCCRLGQCWLQWLFFYLYIIFWCISKQTIKGWRCKGWCAPNVATIHTFSNLVHFSYSTTRLNQSTWMSHKYQSNITPVTNRMQEVWEHIYKKQNKSLRDT